MAVSLISLDCDISCASISKNGTEQIPVWSDDKIKNLWSSLLNLELVSKCYEDEELQGILLLLETTFSVFKNLKKKCNDAESAYQIVKLELESTKEDMCRVEEDLKCCKEAVCERCPELEKELGTQKKKLEYNENRIKSIVSILSINNSSEDSDRNLPSGQKTAVDKAYDLVSQMLLENDNIHLEKDKHFDGKSGIKRLGHDTAESQQMRTPGRKRRKQDKDAAKADILNTKERESDAETLYYGATLAPESVSCNERVMRSVVEKEIVPETLCSQYPVKFSDMEESVPQRSSININEKMDNIQTTPKKQMLQDKITRPSSPILGSCNRKSTHKTTHCNNYNVQIIDSPGNNPVTSKTLIRNGKSDNCVTGSSLHSYKDDANRSPSLLQIEAAKSDSITVGVYKVEDNSQERKNEKHEQNVLCALEDNQESMKNIRADFWKLKPVPNVNVNLKNSIDVGNRKLKQTTLSVASFSKKQDLCRLKEFNGGVRQSSSLADQISGTFDEETSIKLAVQESLNEKENTESVLSENKCPGVRNLRTYSAEDDEFVLESPNASRSRTVPRRKCVYARDRLSVSRKGDITSINVSPRKKQIQSSAGRKDMDETLFVPLYTSTLRDGAYGSRKIKRIPETEELSSEQNFKEAYCPSELKNRKVSELTEKHDCSFDRIPEKISTSPNYKYRRDALRNRDARRRLDGWECEQCKNYYAVANGANPAELKHHLKQCSKHRDKYSVQSSTPPGYWDVNFPNTEESKLEVTLAPKNVPIAKD